MGLTVKELSSPEEMRLVTQLQLRTFLEDGTNLARLMNPTSDPATEGDIDSFTARLIEDRAKERAEGAESVYYAAIDDADGSLMAACRWVFYPAGSTKVYRAPVVTDPGVPIADPAEASARVRYLQWAMNRFYAQRIGHCVGPHAMLDICFTVRAHRRRGAAYAVVDAGVRRSDELGLRAYVEATGNGPLLYQKCGFRPVETIEEHPEGGCFEGRAGWVGFNFQWMERAPRK